jgi:cysteine-S-conjugate beta-lyase
MDAADLQRRLSPRTKLVWLEAPGSVTMEFPPLAQLAAVCRAASVVTALDSTWSSGLAYNGFDAGADIVAHALTKYPSGGGDVLMGAVVTRDDALHLKLKLTHMRMGFGVGANDAEAILRSLPSLALRYHAQDRAARDLALWLQQRPEVARVLHPALPGSPGHEHWRATCGADGAAAGLFSVMFHERSASGQVDAFCDALRLFKLGYSWGGPVSLVVPYELATMRSAASAGGLARGTLVRFSIGLEDVGDLRADLERALAALA